MARPRTILSIDGGGIRGIIPAMVLAYIEQQTGKRTAELFDLIAGTSTGGILALGLTKPGTGRQPQYSAADMLALYVREGARIFSRSVWNRARAVGNAFEEKYPAQGIEQVLTQYFGSTRISQSVTDVLVTSYEIQRRRPFFFKSRNARENQTNDFLMRDAARATSAAPTYFEPVLIRNTMETDTFALVDGGVYANNPGLCAYAEAITYYGSAEEYLVVSLGTGELTRPLRYEDARAWGLIGWAQPILSVVFDGVSDTVDYQLLQLCRKEDDPRYFRFQTSLDVGNDDLDDASATNIQALRWKGDDVIDKNRSQLDRLCSLLTAAPT